MRVMREKAFSWLWCILFGIVLTLPSTGLFREPDASLFKRYEKRAPVTFKVTGNHPKTVISKFEDWFNDRIAFRFLLTEGLSRLYYKLGVSVHPDRVVVGKNGWLFLGNRWGQVVDYHRGLSIMKPEAMDKLTEFFIAMDQESKRRGIPLVISVAPNKHTINPEYLPEWIAASERPTRVETLRKQLKTYQIDLLDLRFAVMKAKKKHGVVFLETNSHWNSLDAFYVYKEIMGVVRNHFPQLIGLDKEPIVINERKVAGGSAFMLQMPEMKSNDYYVLPKHRRLTELYLYRNNERILLNPEEGLYVPLTASAWRIINPQLASKEKLLFISDSFGSAVAPYLSQSFHEVVRVHRSNRKMSYQDLLDTYQPDVVIFLMIERGLLARSLPLKWVKN